MSQRGGLDYPFALRSRVSAACIFLYPTCNFAAPVFCNPARDMSNTILLNSGRRVLRQKRGAVSRPSTAR